MKIVVAHPERQHINPLLKFLDRKHLLLRFFTMFSVGNLNLLWKIPFLLNKKRFTNRQFSITKEKIAHFPILLVIARFLNKKHIHLVKYAYQFFDWWVKNKINNLDFDIVITYENANLITNKLAKKRGKITILDLAAVHHIQNEKLWTRYPVYRDLYVNEATFDWVNERKTKALNYTDYCFCLSKYAYQTLLEGGLKPEQLYITNLGINHSIFLPKKQYNSLDAPLRLLFAGRMSSLKGISELITVVKELAYFPIELYLVGPKDSLDATIIQKLPPNIVYQQSVSQKELVSIYHLADVFINFSYTDSWAQTVLEAMACGTPVIVTENTGAKEAITKDAGFVIPVADTTALKDRILYFHENRLTIQQMGEKASELSQQYTWEKYCSQVLNALTDIAQKEGISL